MDKKIEEMTKGDKTLQDKLKAEYALLNMPEGTEEEIGARLEKARGLAGISSDSSNNATSASEVAGAGLGGVFGGTSTDGEINPQVAQLLASEGIDPTKK